MKTKKRSNKRLPSPLNISLYVLVVAACCIVNWSLLKAGNIVQHDKSLELIIVEEMLENLDPVKIPEFHIPASEAKEYGPELQHWMLSMESYKQAPAGNDLALEDWMINTSSWMAMDGPK
jgi:hypothetical protein